MKSGSIPLKVGPSSWPDIDWTPFAYHIPAMGKRPDHVKAPAYLSKSPPVPQPDPIESVRDFERDPDGGLNPTRFGDWERKGVAVDF